MAPEILILDNNKEVVGRTYPRRAKQLVSKSKAVWIDDSKTSILLQTQLTEDNEMETDNVITLEDEITQEVAMNEELTSGAEDDTLLLYIAGQNVEYRKITNYHIVGMMIFSFLLMSDIIAATDFFLGIWFTVGMYTAVRILKSYGAILRKKIMLPQKETISPLEKEYARLKEITKQ